MCVKDLILSVVFTQSPQHSSTTRKKWVLLSHGKSGHREVKQIAVISWVLRGGTEIWTHRAKSQLSQSFAYSWEMVKVESEPQHQSNLTSPSYLDNLQGSGFIYLERARSASLLCVQAECTLTPSAQALWNVCLLCQTLPKSKGSTSVPDRQAR